MDKIEKENVNVGEISDGYHTFNELYYYRMLYNAAFFNMLPKELVHKSKKHHNGEDCFGGGWFIVMANLPTGQISNHYELKDWDLFQIPVKEKADEWDGHTPQIAAQRLREYILQQHSREQLEKLSTSSKGQCAMNEFKFGVLDGITLKLYAHRPTVFPSFEISLENVKVDFRDNGTLIIEAEKILYDLYHGHKVYENEWVNQPHIREIHEGIRWWKKLFGIKKKERFVYGGWVRANKVENVRYLLSNFKIEYCD